MILIQIDSEHHGWAKCVCIFWLFFCLFLPFLPAKLGLSFCPTPLMLSAQPLHLMFVASASHLRHISVTLVFSPFLLCRFLKGSSPVHFLKLYFVSLCDDLGEYLDPPHLVDNPCLHPACISLHFRARPCHWLSHSLPLLFPLPYHVIKVQGLWLSVLKCLLFSQYSKHSVHAVMVNSKFRPYFALGLPFHWLEWWYADLSSALRNPLLTCKKSPWSARGCVGNGAISAG